MKPISRFSPWWHVQSILKWSPLLNREDSSPTYLLLTFFCILCTDWKNLFYFGGEWEVNKVHFNISYWYFVFVPLLCGLSWLEVCQDYFGSVTTFPPHLISKVNAVCLGDGWSRTFSSIRVSWLSVLKVTNQLHFYLSRRTNKQGSVCFLVRFVEVLESSPVV